MVGPGEVGERSAKGGNSIYQVNVCFCGEKAGIMAPWGSVALDSFIVLRLAPGDSC